MKIQPSGIIKGALVGSALGLACGGASVMSGLLATQAFAQVAVAVTLVTIASATSGAATVMVMSITNRAAYVQAKTANTVRKRLAELADRPTAGLTIQPLIVDEKLYFSGRQAVWGVLMGVPIGNLAGIVVLWESLWGIKMTAFGESLDWTPISRVPSNWLAHNMLLLPTIADVLTISFGLAFTGYIAIVLTAAGILVIIRLTVNPNYPDRALFDTGAKVIVSVGRMIYPKLSDKQILSIVGVALNTYGVILVWAITFFR